MSRIPVDITKKANPKLELAYAQVAESWYPENPDITKQILRKLESGESEKNRKDITTELKQDGALFLRTVKRLSETRGSGEHDPVILIEKASIEELRSALRKTQGSTSPHTFPPQTKAQALRVQHTLVSTITAESLAEQAKISPTEAYTCALLRQLGLTLIAWNYPHIYERAVETERSGEGLERALTRTLGFSPSLLAIRAARAWGLTSRYRAVLGDRGASEVADGTVELLTKICETGEALARACDHEHYPTAEEDWAAAKLEIERRIGPEGFRSLGEKIQTAIAAYAPTLSSLLPEATTTTLTRFKTEPCTPTEPSRLFLKNQYVRSCPAVVQNALRELYQKIDGAVVSRETVDLLVKRVIPETGFPRGAVYLLDPETLNLTPRIVVGGGSVHKYPQVSSSSVRSSLDPVAIAYRSNVPINEEECSMGERTVSYVASSLGTVQRIGVLYLEYEPKPLGLGDTNPVTIFKALRQALCDCLGLY